MKPADSFDLKKFITEGKLLKENPQKPTHTMTIYSPDQVDFIVNDLKEVGAVVIGDVEKSDDDYTSVNLIITPQQLQEFEELGWGTANGKDDWYIEEYLG